MSDHNTTQHNTKQHNTTSCGNGVVALDFKTKDTISFKIENIKQLFPNVLTEGKIDYEKFREYDELAHLTNEAIHKRNNKIATQLVINLIERIKDKIGEVKTYKNLHVTDGNAWHDNGTAINGFVEGEKGKVQVSSIVAGGHNIQRLHVRVLVKKVK